MLNAVIPKNKIVAHKNLRRIFDNHRTIISPINMDILSAHLFQARNTHTPLILKLWKDIPR